MKTTKTTTGKTFTGKQFKKTTKVGVDPTTKAQMKYSLKMAKVNSPHYQAKRGGFGKTVRTKHITSAIKTVGKEAFDDGNRNSANLGSAYLQGLINPSSNSNETLNSTGQGKGEFATKGEALDQAIGSIKDLNDLFG